MKIAYIPQISMRTYEKPSKWFLKSDAQLTKMCAYVNNAPRDWRWHWVVPQAEKVIEYPSLPANCSMEAVPWMDNVLQGRFHFPMPELQRWISDVEPDVLLCEIPEHVRAFRVIQKTLGLSFSIVAMFEHVDIYDETKVDVSYTLRQIDGYIEADYCAFPLEGMAKEWHKAANNLLVDADKVLDRGKELIWPGIFSSEEVTAAMPYITVNDKPEILFISRLTDEKRTKAKQFLTTCDELLKSGEEFTVKVADPNRSMTDAEINELCESAEITRFNDRTEYYEALWQADIVPILYPLKHIYSVGHCEAAFAENVIITMGDELDGHVVVTNDNIKMAIREAVRRVRDEDRRIHEITEAIKERDVMWSYYKFNQNMEEITK